MSEYRCENCETPHDSIDGANECCTCETCARMEQLSNEMLENESVNSHGWRAARSFFAKEIRAILNKEKPPTSEV